MQSNDISIIQTLFCLEPRYLFPVFFSYFSFSAKKTQVFLSTSLFVTINSVPRKSKHPMMDSPSKVLSYHPTIIHLESMSFLFIQNGQPTLFCTFPKGRAPVTAPLFSRFPPSEASDIRSLISCAFFVLFSFANFIRIASAR